MNLYQIEMATVSQHRNEYRQLRAEALSHDIRLTNRDFDRQVFEFIEAEGMTYCSASYLVAAQAVLNYQKALTELAIQSEAYYNDPIDGWRSI